MQTTKPIIIKERKKMMLTCTIQKFMMSEMNNFLQRAKTTCILKTVYKLWVIRLLGELQPAL